VEVILKKFVSFSIGFFTGAVVMGVITLLFAPESGAGLRESLKDSLLQTKNEISAAAQQKRMELEAELNKLRQVE
jgi:gas vesicle protein